MDNETKPPNDEPVYVFAANHYDYIDFLHRNKLSKLKYIYISNIDTLRGTLRVKYIETELSYLNPKYYVIQNMLTARMAEKVKV